MANYQMANREKFWVRGGEGVERSDGLEEFRGNMRIVKEVGEWGGGRIKMARWLVVRWLEAQKTKHKSEWFLVIKGECKLCLEDVVTKTGEERAITEKDNVLVHIGPNVAHVFVNTGSSELILLAFVNEVLDHQNPDTYEYKINL